MTVLGVPPQSEMEATIKVVTDHAERIFVWDYDRSRDQLVTLYNKAMGSQWSSVTDLDWSIEVDPESVLFFVQTVHLGLLLQRGAGAEAPDPSRWEQLIARVVASFGDGTARPAADRHPEAELVAGPSAAASAIVGPPAEHARGSR